MEKGNQQGKNKTPQDENPNSSVSPTSAPCSRGHEPPAEAEAPRGGRRAGRMQPSGPGWNTARTTIQAWGRPVLASCWGDRGTEGSCGLGHHGLKLQTGETPLLFLQPSMDVLWVCLSFP